MFDITKYLEETITSLNNSIVSTLLSTPSFNLESGTVVWWIFMICLVWQLTTIFIDFASSGGFDSKKIINLVASTVIVFYAYGKFNPRSVSGLDFGLAGTEYDYKGKKTLLRDTHGVFRKFFNEFAENVTGQNELTKGDVSQTLSDWTEKRSYIENICDGVNNKKGCMEDNLKLSIADLKEKHISGKCGTFSSPFCDDFEEIKAKFFSPIAFGTLVTKVLGIIKMVLIVIVFVGYTIITVMSLVMLKIIFPFLILEKTRPAIITATKFYISTSAFVFVIKIFRFIVASITLGVVEALSNLEYTDPDSFVAKSVIGTMLIVAVVIIEVGMLFATPKLTQALFNLQLEVFTRITDELKNSALLIGSVFTGGIALTAASKVMGTGAASKIGSTIGSKIGDKANNNFSNGNPTAKGSNLNQNRFGEKSKATSGVSGGDNNYGNASNSNQFDSSRRPFSGASTQQTYDSGKEPDSVVDVDDLNTNDIKKEANTESRGTQNNTERKASGDSDVSGGFDFSGPESVVDKNTNWNSLGNEPSSKKPKKNSKDKNYLNKKDSLKGSEMDTEDLSSSSEIFNKLSREEAGTENNKMLPSTTTSFESEDLRSDLTTSSGNKIKEMSSELSKSGDTDNREEKNDDILDAEWREIKDEMGDDISDGALSDENGKEEKGSKIKKIGSAALKGMITTTRVTTNVLKGISRLTNAAVDAGKGNSGGVDNFRDELLAIPNLGKRRIMAKRILNDPESNLGEKDRIVLTDFLDIHKGQRPEHKKRAESIIENYESELSLRKK